MNRMWWMAAGVLAGCDPKGDDTAEAADPVFDTERDCTVGFEVGQCPRDFTLTNQAGEAVTLSELVGQPVVVVGAAEW
ncbi:MAG: cytochrome oxidase Cu insertion factor (SCO1/SenC/PrrC family) [Myxococcota bacterium]|jgi:cytochrome oxidase Cu insertion factor (SCO1/SenC/PrrC family)